MHENGVNSFEMDFIEQCFSLMRKWNFPCHLKSKLVTGLYRFTPLSWTETGWAIKMQ